MKNFNPKNLIKPKFIVFFLFMGIATNLLWGQATVNSDVPIAFLESYTGKYSYTQTGGSLRSSPNSTDMCSLNTSSSAALSGIPAGATVYKAYLYWAGSGPTDNTVTFQGNTVTAARTRTSSISYTTTETHFGCVADVTSIVTAGGNATYTFTGLTVTNSNTGGNYCTDGTVLAGWALIVIYQDNTMQLPHKINLYEGWDVKQGSDTSSDGFQFVMTGLQVPPTNISGKTSYLVWEGDETRAGTAAAPEQIKFNGNVLTDTDNPSTNAFNSTINTLPSTTTYGVDLDTYNVSEYLAPGATSATVNVTTGGDLIFSNLLIVDASTYNIDAVNDSYALTPGKTTSASVLANDIVNYAAATTSNVTLTQVSTTNAGVTLDPATGLITVSPYVVAGTYTVTYQICDKIVTPSCDTATATVTVNCNAGSTAPVII